MFLELDHLGIVVRDLEQAVKDYTALGFLLTETRDVPHLGLRVAFFPAANGQFVDLAEPLDPNSEEGKHLAQHGEGLHHLALRVNNLEATVEHFRKAGAEVFNVALDRKPPARRGVWVSPKSTHGVTIQLLDQRPTIKPWPPGKTDAFHTICHDHVAIVVRDLEQAIKDYQRLGFVLGSRMGTAVRTFTSVKDYERLGYVLTGGEGRLVLGIKTAVFPMKEADGFIELVQPTDPKNLAAQQLARHGEGMWVWALRVKDLSSAVARWQKAGGRILYQMKGRPPLGQDLGLMVDTPGSHGVTVEFFDRPMIVSRGG